jgi:thiol-disulfide isomerase/thioredoxin
MFDRKKISPFGSRTLLALAALSFAAPVRAVTFKPLSIEELGEMKRQPCTLIHVWASWCAPCVQELPELLRGLPAIAKLNPVVIDASPPQSQDSASRKLLEQINPAFPVYRKPGGNDDAYLNAIDGAWSGALPYSALFDGGKRKKAWEGPVPLATLKKAVAQYCKTASSAR